MKRVIPLLIIPILLFAACGKTGVIDTTTSQTAATADTTTPAVTTADPMSPEEIFAEYGQTLVADINQYLIAGAVLTATTPLPNLPIYTNAFPLQPSGLPAYDASETVQNKIKDNLDTLLKLVYGSYGSADGIEMADETLPWLYRYKYAGDGSSNPAAEFNMRPTGGSMDVPIAFANGFTADAVQKLVDSDRYVNAAFRYVGITDPVVVPRTSILPSGEKTTSYTVINRAETPLRYAQSLQFRCVTIAQSENGALIMFEKWEPLNAASINGVYNIPYIAALDMLEAGDSYLQGTDGFQRGITVDTSRVVGCEIEYVADIYEKLIVPCYAFYVDTGIPGHSQSNNILQGTMNLAVFYVPIVEWEVGS